MEPVRDIVQFCWQEYPIMKKKWVNTAITFLKKKKKGNGTESQLNVVNTTKNGIRNIPARMGS